MALSTIAANQIASLPASSVDTAQLASSAVTSAKLASGAITSAAMPTGSVVQVVQSTTTSNWYQTSAQTWQDVTGQTVTITPSSSSNKVLITVRAWGIIYNPAGCAIRLLRGSTVIHEMVSYVTDTQWSQGCYTFSYLDSPSTTSATTYKIQGYSQTTTATAEFRFNYSNNPYPPGPPQSTMIAQEIAG